MKRKDIFITIFLALYILLFYIPLGVLPELLARGVFYMLLGVTGLKIVTRQTPLKVSQYMIWYLSFCALGLLSSYYANDQGHVYKDMYVMFVLWIVSLSFVQYVQDAAGFKRLFFIFAYSPFFLVFYLILNRITLIQGERLGDRLFNNANQIAMFLMISIFCISWFIIYANPKYRFVNIVTLVIFLYLTALTGGRKYILIPFVFFLLLIVFKNWKKNKPRMILYLFIFIIVVFLAIWSISNIPALYYSIGVRFESLLSILDKDLANPDASTRIRYMMIENGWMWFVRRPILGYGLNNFSYLFSQVLYDGYAHNNYIEIMVDLGMIGLIVYYSFYFFLVVKLIKVGDDGTGLKDFFLACVLVLFVFEIGSVTYKYFPVQILLGLASAYVWLCGKKGKIAMNRAIHDFVYSYSR